MTPTIVPLRSDLTAQSVEAACAVAGVGIYACDFYVTGIEREGKPFAGGYERGRIFNIDHHAPTREMERYVTSTMLALAAIRAGVVTDEPAYTVINHTDCDSILSSALVMGLVPAKSTSFRDVSAALATASVNADHTGEADPIADLLQGLDEQRNGDRTDSEYLESLRNLLLLLDGKPLEPAGELALRNRADERAQAEELVQSGRVRQDGHVAFGDLSDEIDGALFLPFLPDARVIMLVSRHPNDVEKRVVKLRLGKGALAGFTLNSLDIKAFDPAFGGRWNAGSDKRGGGTARSPSDYLLAVEEAIDEYDDGDHRVSR